jgi:hypothetical protein
MKKLILTNGQIVPVTLQVFNKASNLLVDNKNSAYLYLDNQYFLIDLNLTFKN